MTQLQNLKHLVDDLNLPAPDAMAPDANAEMRFDWIAPPHVLIDRGYQRRISRASLAKIRKMVKSFDWRQFGAIIVVQNERDQYACIDGQHRLIAAYAVGATRVPAMVFHADHAQQAQAFVGVNVNRTSVASIDKFRARVAAGDPAATTVNDILTGLNICTDVAPGYSLTPKQTRATAKLEKLVKAIGRGLTYTTLEMLTDAQPDQANLLTAFAIEATALALAQTVEQEGDLDRLQRTLAGIDFESLKDDAAHLVKLQGGQTSRRGAQQILRIYNKGLQKKVEL